MGKALSLWGVAFLLAGAAGCDRGGEAELRRIELRQQRQRLVRQFHSVQNQIRPTQAAALDAEGVRAAQERFYERLRARMAEIDPRAGEWLDRATEVGRDLARATGDVPVAAGVGDTTPVAGPEEKQRIAGDLRDLERRLRPIQDSAMRAPRVAEAFRALQDSVVAEMKRLRPDAGRLLDQMRELERRIGEIDAELAALAE